MKVKALLAIGVLIIIFLFSILGLAIQDWFFLKIGTSTFHYGLSHGSEYLNGFSYIIYYNNDTPDGQRMRSAGSMAIFFLVLNVLFIPVLIFFLVAFCFEEMILSKLPSKFGVFLVHKVVFVTVIPSLLMSGAIIFWASLFPYGDMNGNVSVGPGFALVISAFFMNFIAIALVYLESVNKFEFTLSFLNKGGNPANYSSI